MLKGFINKNKLIFIGTLFSLTGLTIFCLKIINSYSDEFKKYNALNRFYYSYEYSTDKSVKDEEINYIASIEIPKINLKSGLVDKNSKYNDVNSNIQILKDSQMPEEENGNLILAAHSGDSPVAYFKNINKLVNGDSVYIIYNCNKYEYRVNNSYTVKKMGKLSIIRDKNKKTLTLITCIGDDKQLVIILELYNSVLIE